MKEFFLPCGPYRIAVYESGSGSVPLVLLHGGGVDSAMLSWREVMEAMPAGYTVYAMDLPGYGKSDRPEDLRGESFYPKHIETVECAADRLGLGKFALAGLSMGGAIAIGCALKNPERVAALIPVDSWGLVSRYPAHGLTYWYVRTPLLKTSFRLMAKHRWLVRRSLETSLIGDRSKVTEALVDEVFELCQGPNPERPMQDYQRSSLTKRGTVPDYTGRFRELKMPVLFINGEKDPLVRAKDAARAARSVQNGRLYILKGCKHWAQKERPEETCKAMDGFLREVMI